MESKKLFEMLFQKYFKGFDINKGLFGKSASQAAPLLFREHYLGLKAGLRLCDSLAGYDFLDLERDFIDWFGEDLETILKKINHR